MRRLGSASPTAAGTRGSPRVPPRTVGDVLMVGETVEAHEEQVSEVYRLDPATASAEKIFTIDGYFYGAHPVGGAQP